MVEVVNLVVVMIMMGMMMMGRNSSFSQKWHQNTYSLKPVRVFRMYKMTWKLEHSDLAHISLLGLFFILLVFFCFCGHWVLVLLKRGVMKWVHNDTLKVAIFQLKKWEHLKYKKEKTFWYTLLPSLYKNSSVFFICLYAVIKFYYPKKTLSWRP